MDAAALTSPGGTLNKNLMLSFYLIIPIALGIMLFDGLYLDGAWKQALPMTPDDWTWWTVIFGMPHIVASLLTISDKEYLAHYKDRLLMPLLAFSLVCIGIPLLGGAGALSLVIALYTIYHLIAQQYGISGMLLKRRPDRVMTALRWLSIVASVLMYVLSYSSQLFPDTAYAGISATQWLNVAVALTLSGVIVLGIHVSRTATAADTGHGQWHLWLNIVMLLACFACASFEYAALLIIVPRVVHDLTAFAVYSNHDHNRQAARPEKAVYRVFAFTRLPVFVLCPMLSVLIAAVAFQYKNEYTMVVVNVITFMHYYMEGIIWKREGLHRHYLRFN
jgi:hypothetical protein